MMSTIQAKSIWLFIAQWFWSVESYETAGAVNPSVNWKHELSIWYKGNENVDGHGYSDEIQISFITSAISVCVQLVDDNFTRKWIINNEQAIESTL